MPPVSKSRSKTVQPSEATQPLPPGVYACAEDDATPEAAPGPTEISRDLTNVKEKVLRLAAERERLPQPLFWSLFHSRLRDIKQAKQVERVLHEALDGLE